MGLALGGGAARGIAHVGVIRGLVREGIPIDVVTGTSMGAVIGGAFASIQDIAEVERRVRLLLASDEFRKTRLAFIKETKHSRGSLLYSVTNLVRRGVMYGLSTMQGSFLSAEEFVRSLAAILPDVDVRTDRDPFAATAVDLEAAEEVVLCGGNLREVAAASSAIPGLLPPRRLHGRLLVDGGWVDKIPVLPAFRLGADIVIAVDISAALEVAKSYRHGIDVVIRSNLIKDAVLTAFHRRFADVVIEPARAQDPLGRFRAGGLLYRGGRRRREPRGAQDPRALAPGAVPLDREDADGKENGRALPRRRELAPRDGVSRG